MSSTYNAIDDLISALQYSDKAMKDLGIPELARDAAGEAPMLAFTPQMLRILMEVARQPGGTMRQIADRCNTALSSTCRDLNSLGQWHRVGEPGFNFIEMVEDPKERDQQRAFLTATGKHFAERVIEVLRPRGIVTLEA